MTPINRTVTEETPVTVVMKGEQHVYSLAGAGSAALASWSNTLSDLTGYRPDYIRNRLLATLPTQYGVELITAAGDLCPITFMVTLTASQKEAASA